MGGISKRKFNACRFDDVTTGLCGIDSLAWDEPDVDGIDDWAGDVAAVADDTPPNACKIALFNINDVIRDDVVPAFVSCSVPVNGTLANGKAFSVDVIALAN